MKGNEQDETPESDLTIRLTMKDGEEFTVSPYRIYDGCAKRGYKYPYDMAKFEVLNGGD